MGGKKKTAGKGGKKKEEEEDLSVEQFWKAYKKKCTELECVSSKILKEKYDEYEEEEEKITKFHIWEELGWAGIRAIMDSLRQVGYPHCRSIRLWKTYCEDEGVRAVCQFVEVGKGVSVLELLDNKITPLGCEFISRAIHPRSNTALLVLKLDHNDFGSGGIRALADGLSLNKTITSLSLTYCNIDYQGSRALFEILIFQKSGLEELNLTGNHLRNEGVIVVLRGLSIAKSLKKIFLTDN
jgi:Ran GTPase-activating protein (RanGAP) involved in mRNA processing and transport